MAEAGGRTSVDGAPQSRMLRKDALPVAVGLAADQWYSPFMGISPGLIHTLAGTGLGAGPAGLGVGSAVAVAVPNPATRITVAADRRIIICSVCRVLVRRQLGEYAFGTAGSR